MNRCLVSGIKGLARTISVSPHRSSRAAQRAVPSAMELTASTRLGSVNSPPLGRLPGSLHNLVGCCDSHFWGMESSLPWASPSLPWIASWQHKRSCTSVVSGKFRPPVPPGSWSQGTRSAQGPQEARAERGLEGHPNQTLRFTAKGPETVRGGDTEQPAIVTKLGTELSVPRWFQNQPNRAVNSCSATVQPWELGSEMCPS